MANQRTLEMLLLARDKASQVFDKVKGKFKALQAVGGALTVAFKAIAAATAIVGAAMTGGLLALKKFAAASEVQRLAVNKLELALKNIGKFTPEASEEMQKFASALQGVTTVGDETILTGSALIATLGGLSGEGLKKATVAALDLSAAIGIDFQTASNLMGRAAAGNTSSLSRYGLTIEKTGDAQKDFEALLGVIEQKMGGSASLATDSFTGKVTQLSNAWGDAIEQLGQGANESERLQEIIQKLTQFIQKNGDVIVAFGEKLANFAATAIEFMIDKFLNARKIMGNFLLDMSKIADSMATAAEKIGLPTDALRGLSGEAAQLSLKLFTAQQEIDKTREIQEIQTEATKKERDAMLELSGFVDATGEAFKELGQNTTESLDNTLQTLQEFVPEVVATGEAIGTNLAQSVEAAYVAEEPAIIEAVSQTVDGVQKTMSNLTTQVEITRTKLIAGITKTFGLTFGVGAAKNLEEFSAATRAAVGFADGAIVRKPTFGMVGEGPEDEAILPLSKLGALIGGAAGGRGGGDTNITITGPFIGTDTEARLWAKRLVDFWDEERARR